MGHFFEKSWQRSTVSKSPKEKLLHLVHKDAPLKPRIAEAIKQLNIPLIKLDSMYKKIQQQNNMVFEKIIEAQKNNEMQKASMLATELAELRKHEKMLGNARLAFEQIKLRLTTVNDFGEAMTAMGPAMSVMNSIKPSLERIMPESDVELNTMNEMLGEMMTDTLGGGSNDQFDMNSISAISGDMETDSILQEANSILEKEMEEKLPDVPSDVSTESNAGKTAVYE